MKERIAILLSLILLFGSFCITAYAHEVPDWSMDGKSVITVHMKYGKTAVGGGTLAAYRVADVVMDEDGNYSFSYGGGPFKDCGQGLTNLNSALAKAMKAYAETEKITPYRDKVNIGTMGDTKGMAKFENLELGLYLIVQTKPAYGYNVVDPFLVSVPFAEKDADGNVIYRYAVDASPKVELEKASPKPPERPHGSRLPQTGQLNWPVPVLTVAGLVLFGCGWLLRFGKKKKEQ